MNDYDPGAFSVPVSEYGLKHVRTIAQLLHGQIHPFRSAYRLVNNGLSEMVKHDQPDHCLCALTALYLQEG